jgi:hypothetical protein
MGKPEGDSPQENIRQICEDNIKMDLKVIGLGVVDWIRLVQERD